MFNLVKILYIFLPLSTLPSQLVSILIYITFRSLEWLLRMIWGMILLLWVVVRMFTIVKALMRAVLWIASSDVILTAFLLLKRLISSWSLVGNKRELWVHAQFSSSASIERVLIIDWHISIAESSRIVVSWVIPKLMRLIIGMTTIERLLLFVH